MKKKKLVLKLCENNPEVGYLYLAAHPGRGSVGVSVKQIALAEIIDNYIGPPIYLDFNKTGEIIGIEIIP